MSPWDIDSLQAFGETIRARKREEEKNVLDRKEIEARQRRIAEHNQAMLETLPYYPFLNKSFVYFVKGRHTNVVKIGWSNDVHTRVRDVARAHFDGPCRVIGLFQGGVELETRCHEIFESYRVPGTKEMFHYSDMMEKHLQSVMTDEEKSLVKGLNDYVSGHIPNWDIDKTEV